MLPVDEARELVLAAVAPLPVVEVPLSQASGLVLATDLTAPHPLPRFDNSAMDGYALLSGDVAEASETNPIKLALKGEIRAGTPGDIKVEPGTAVRIMTGAVMPAGADAVVQLELTEEGADHVLIKSFAQEGRNVRPAGDDLAAGDVYARAGLELRSGELALLASMGVMPVPVHPSPRVALLVTGDELVDASVDPAPGQIRDSNSVALSALVAEAGAIPVRCPLVADDLAAVKDALRRAAAEADLVVSSGGVAVGRYDFVKQAIEELGHIGLWRVAMQPGKPVVLGRIGETPFLGLPGNPVSIHVAFEQFVRPAIRKMRGCVDLLRPTLRATLTEGLTKKPGRLHFVRVRLRREGVHWAATPTGSQGSHIQSSLIDVHGVAVFPADATSLSAGEDVTVEVWRLPGEST